MTAIAKQPFIRLENVKVTFGEQIVLQSLNVEFDEMRIAVIGANGSGKSTFLRLLNGLQLPASGQVMVDGHDTIKDGKAIRRKVGFVFQNPDNQIVMPTVEEDIAFGLKNLKLDREILHQRIENVLDQYDLTHIMHQSTYNLSGGQKQLMAICGVLVMEPQLIIFDEPTTQLDLRNKRRVGEVINGLSQRIIVVTHDMSLIEDFDRVLVFDCGRIVCDDKPEKAISFYERLMA